MPRNSTTALYTRVDNTFSNPIVGTTISPTDADTFFDDVEASMNSFIATSVTSIEVGLGAKTFTVQSGKSLLEGMSVQIFSDADHANSMYGTVTSYSTTSLVVDVTVIAGSGTFADWTIFTAGARGGTGATGTAATVAAGTTTTLAEGESATFVNSGTSAAAVWDVGIPRGAVPAVGFNFSTTTTDSDPGAGNIRFNNATPASVTAIYFDNTDRDGNTVTAWLDSFDDSTNTAKGTLILTSAATPATKLVFDVSGSVVDGTGYRKVTVSHVSGATLPSNAAHLGVVFSRSGDKGLDGAGVGDMIGANNLAVGAGGVADAATAFANIKQAATTIASGVVELATDAETQTGSDTSRAITPANLTAAAVKQGVQTIGIPMAAWKAKASAGATSVTYQDIPMFSFNGTSAARVRTLYRWPKSWDEGTIQFSVSGLVDTGGGSGNVAVFKLAGKCFSHDDPAWTTTDLSTGAQSVTLSWTADDDVLMSSFSSALTLDGSPAEGDLVVLELWRDPADGSDNNTAAFLLADCQIKYTINSATDA